MRVVHSSRSALDRQARQAIRIKKRGEEGAILNYKAEFSRCYIPMCLCISKRSRLKSAVSKDTATISLFNKMSYL